MREWLKEIRLDKLINQAEAAEICGVSKSYFNMIENCTRGAKLPVSTAKKIAAALGFDWQRFYQDGEN